MTENGDAPARGQDAAPQVLTPDEELAEVRAELDQYAAEVAALRKQVAAALTREVFLNLTIAHLRADLDRAGVPATVPGGLLTLAA